MISAPSDELDTLHIELREALNEHARRRRIAGKILDSPELPYERRAA